MHPSPPAKQLYDSLYVSEIVKFLQREEAASYDLMVSGDVFPYLGDLHALFTCARQVISVEGSFIFSVEHLEADDDQPRLQQSGRFAHSPAYILNAAAATGWQIKHSAETDLRLERGEWIPGCIYLMTRV